MPIKIKGKKYYSEKEVDKMINDLAEATKEVYRLEKTKIPRCIICKKEFLKLDKWTWKPSCLCIKKNLRLSIG